ncbi:effector-associated domain EAD1-containing protein [Frankia sp. EI5c]|uniref:effector-associated domain EAD1-containing protein n=1 Tax=Frankia sp. EI5c TaxID=683316 RepID=UPI0037BF0BCB
MSLQADHELSTQRRSGSADPSRFPPTGSATGADYEAAQQTSSNPGVLTELELETLARIYCDPKSAREALARAGLPIQRLPEWNDPISFWRRVGELVGNGVVAGGREKVLSVACADFPANPVLTALHGERPPVGE